jgi:hypothetical protein
VMTVVMVMRSRGECRSGEHQDQKHSSKNLLHGLNLARSECGNARGRFMNQVRKRLIPPCGDLT